MNLSYREIKKLSGDLLNSFFQRACLTNELKDIKTYIVLLQKKSPSLQQCLDNGLITACGSNSLDVIKYLLTAKELTYHADINAKGGLAICQACNIGSIELVNYLLTSPDLKEHASINSMNGLPFKNACANNHLELVKYLLESNNFKPLLNRDVIKDGLIHACKNGQLGIVQYLLESTEIKRFTDYKACLNQGLSVAIERNCLDVVRYFIFDLKLEKTEEITKKLKSFPSKKIDEWYKIQEMNKELENELTNKNGNKPKIKI